MSNVLITEKNGTSGNEICYVKPPDQANIVAVSKHETDNLTGTKIISLLKEIFLPKGYPSSVSDDYIYYQIWDTAQAFCSSINGILATQAVLKGVGVGDAESTPLAATITWVIKDGTGHIGRIMFAWWKGSSLDSESKKWRLIADILNDTALFVEVCLPLFYGLTTYVLCLSTIMKAIVGVAGGATRAALTQHHAIRGNLGDVAAKDGSQETAVNLIASVFGILIISIFKENIWLPFFTFTIFHVIANYFAVKSVCLNTFNTYRFMDTLYYFLTEGKFSSPKEVNNREPILMRSSISNKLPTIPIIMGHSLVDLIKTTKITLNEVQQTINTYKNSDYLIFVDSNKTIHVALKHSADSKIILEAYFHASLLGIMIHSDDISLQNAIQLEGYEKKTTIDFETLSKISHKKWLEFFKGLNENEWTFERHLISCGEWRIK